MSTTIIAVDKDVLIEALRAVGTRVAWYRARRKRIPSATVKAFNALCDALHVANAGRWSRITPRAAGGVR